MVPIPAAKKEKPVKADSLQAQLQAKIVNPVSLAIFCVLLIVSILLAAALGGQVSDAAIAAQMIALNLIGLYVLFALKIANQWEKAIVLRFGSHCLGYHAIRDRRYAITFEKLSWPRRFLGRGHMRCSAPVNADHADFICVHPRQFASKDSAAVGGRAMQGDRE